MPDDQELIERYLRGDDSAFERFYCRHRRPLYVYLVSLVAAREIAEELLQETFLGFLGQVARSGASLRARAALVTIARSRAIDWLRRRRVEARAMRSRFSDPFFRARETYLPREAGRAETEAVDADRLNELLWRLPDAQREAVLLRSQLELSFAEIGRLTGVKEATAVSRYRYGVERLREALVGGSPDARKT